MTHNTQINNKDHKEQTTQKATSWCGNVKKRIWSTETTRKNSDDHRETNMQGQKASWEKVAEHAKIPNLNWILHMCTISTFILGLRRFTHIILNRSKHKHLLFYSEKVTFHIFIKPHTLFDSQHNSSSNCQLNGNPPVGGDNGVDLLENGWMPQRDIPGSAGITKRRWPLADFCFPGFYQSDFN